MTNSSTEFNDFTSEGHRRPSKHVVLVLDFGSQYSRLIVRRLRAIGAYSELISCSATAKEISAIRPAAVVLSGGPSSVYEEGAPHLNRDVWELLQEKRVPILGICYGMQEIVYQLGGRVIGGGEAREYGKTIITINNYINNNNNNNNNLMDNDAAAAEAKEAELAADEAAAAAAAAAAGGEPWPVPAAHAATAPSLGDLFYGIKGPDVQVWMSHGDKVEQLPSSFIALASTSSCPYVAAAAPNLGVYTLQFHPEVTHTPCGVYILKNYILRICKLQLNWCMHTYLPRQIQLLQQQIQKKHVIGALSGGVDSTVAAALLYKAIGNQFYAFFIDTGLLRKNEAEETMHALRNCFPDLSIECIDAKDRFINALVDVKDPEQKRKIIGALFIDVFEEAVQKKNIPVKGTLLLQGTLYPDVIESKSYKGPSKTIKTHHNVGGLPQRMQLQVLEPLRDLFKDEVRSMGRELGLPEERILRHPFPGPGLAVRIIGCINKERINILQQADYIFIQEIKKAGLYNHISQAFAVLLPECRSVGVMGDGRTYEYTCALRAVHTEDYMSADIYYISYELLSIISNRITNEVKGINRVVYDISSKPPATIEWE